MLLVQPCFLTLHVLRISSMVSVISLLMVLRSLSLSDLQELIHSNTTVIFLCSLCLNLYTTWLLNFNMFKESEHFSCIPIWGGTTNIPGRSLQSSSLPFWPTTFNNQSHPDNSSSKYLWHHCQCCSSRPHHLSQHCICLSIGFVSRPTLSNRMFCEAGILPYKNCVIRWNPCYR